MLIMAPLPLALAGGTVVFIAILIVIGLAIAYGIYTRTGSGVGQHPWRRGAGSDAPGAEGPDEYAEEDEERVPFDHGTR
jgi:hypothetical protein